MNLAMLLPMLLVVLANTFYQICAKSIPSGMNTFAALSVTYAVAALCSIALFFVSARGGNLLTEYRQLNWSSFVLGLCIVGLEAGFILMYQAGWGVSTAQVVSSSFLAVVLLFVGYFLYHEAITFQRIAGLLICLFGLYLLNR